MQQKYSFYSNHTYVYNFLINFQSNMGGFSIEMTKHLEAFVKVDQLLVLMKV